MHVEPEHTYITISTSAQQIQELIPHLKQPFSKIAPDSFHEKAPIHLLVTQKKLIFAYLKTDSYHGTARHTMDTAF